MDERKVIDLTNDELMNELVYCDTAKKHYYARYEEVFKEIKRRCENK